MHTISRDWGLMHTWVAGNQLVGNLTSLRPLQSLTYLDCSVNQCGRPPKRDCCSHSVTACRRS